jgi:DnaK suppressor protein
MNQAGREGLALRAQQVRAALERIAAGTYGACAACEEEVGYARLKARPETPFCIACQTRRERR